MTLMEAPVEGMHAQVQRTVTRCRSAMLPYVFSELRFATNWGRIRSWLQRPGGREVVAHHWWTYKNVLGNVATTHGNRHAWNRFTSTFYRLRGEGIGDVACLLGSTQDQGHMPPLQLLIADRLRMDWARKICVPDRFFSLPGLGADGVLFCFTVVRWYSGQERLVRTVEATDRRHMVSMQAFSVWSKQGQRYPPAAMSVYPLDEPKDVVLLDLVPSFASFRAGLFLWEVRVSDTQG